MMNRIKKVLVFRRYGNAQRGATLIELMISVFVFAIGVLGYSALQTKSIQATSDNAQREDVVWMTDALMGRIRVNLAARGTYADVLSNFNSTSAECTAAPATICGQNSGASVDACAPAAMATYDIWDEFCNTATGRLPAVKGLTVNLTDDGTNITLESTWCSRAVESEVVAEAADGEEFAACTNPMAAQTYELVFRP